MAQDDESHLRFLERAIALAAEAREHGNCPL